MLGCGARISSLSLPPSLFPRLPNPRHARWQAAHGPQPFKTVTWNASPPSLEFPELRRSPPRSCARESLGCQVLKSTAATEEWHYQKPTTTINFGNLEPVTLHSESQTLNPQPSTFNPQASTLDPQPSTLNPHPSTLNPQLSTLNPQSSNPNPQPSTFNPRPSTLNPQLSTLHPQPSTPNPEP